MKEFSKIALAVSFVSVFPIVTHAEPHAAVAGGRGDAAQKIFVSPEKNTVNLNGLTEIVCVDSEETAVKAAAAEATKGDYVIWPNGGGRVHKDAKVSKSAFIKNSTVEANAIVGDAVILSSTIGGKTGKVHVRDNTYVRSSALNGDVMILEDSIITSSALNGNKGKIQLQRGARVDSSSINDPTVLENGAWLRSSTFNAKTTLQDGSYVSSSTTNQPVEVGDRAYVNETTFNTKTSVGENQVVYDGKTLK